MRTRKFGKPDRNQADIVTALRKIGAGVMITSGNGQGEPDLIVGWQCRNVALEIKMPGEKLTAAEEIFKRTWPGEYHVVDSVQKAIQAVTRT
jgi:hypothetical protein